MKPTALTLRIGTIERLVRYVAMQLGNMFPDPDPAGDVPGLLLRSAPKGLERLRPILAAVRNFDPGSFDHLNSLQYATFLYLLANQCWHDGAGAALPARLFCLNRALNAIDLFYAVELPPVFFISHGLSAVLGRATYGNRLVFFQNVTVGRVGNHSPVLGHDVVLFPGSQVTGNSIIGDRCVVSAGTHVHGLAVPDDMLVFRGPTGIVLKPRRKDYIDLYLRPPND